jgi:SAM-dependent methyltransferase
LVPSEDVWLRSTWSFVRSHLPAAPSRVVELGCGDHGGHLSALHDAGYDAVGVDPQAPDGPAYYRIPFEKYHADRPMDAVIASLSLHHVTDPDAVLDQVRDLLMPGGTLVVIEWAWEHFDEATAQWCFRRLPRIDADGDGWLHRRQAGWAQSGLPWDRFCHNWAQEPAFPRSAMYPVASGHGGSRGDGTDDHHCVEEGKTAHPYGRRAPRANPGRP